MISKFHEAKRKREVLDDIASIIDSKIDGKRNLAPDIARVSAAAKFDELTLFRDALRYYQKYKPKMPDRDPPKRRTYYTHARVNYSFEDKRKLVAYLNEMMIEYRKERGLSIFDSLVPLQPGISGEFYHTVIDYLTARMNGKQR